MKEEVIAALMALKDERGRLTPDRVVDAARDEQNPLHGEFEWDDSIAAQRWRTYQARLLIGAVPLVITETDERRLTPHFVRDPAAAADEQGYIAVTSLMDDPEAAAKAVKYEFVRALAAMKRAEEISDALGVKRLVSFSRRQLERTAKRIESQIAQQTNHNPPAPPA